MASKGLVFWDVDTCWPYTVSVLGAMQHTCDHSSFRHSILIWQSLHYIHLLSPNHFAQHPFPQHFKTHNKGWFIPKEVSTDFFHNCLLFRSIILQATYHKNLLEGWNHCLSAIWIIKRYTSRYKDIETILREKLKIYSYILDANWVQKQKQYVILEF